MHNSPLNNMRIRSKLVLFLIVPVLTLLFFSISSINIKYQEQLAAQKSLDFISVAFATSDLIFELQKERGLSSGFVGSNGNLNKDSLLVQRKNTDEKLQQFKLSLKEKDPEQNYWGLGDVFSRMQYKLEKIPILRFEVDALRGDKFFNEYSEINTAGLNINRYLETLISNIDLVKLSDAYNTLLWLQERSGQERGLLNGIFASGQLTAQQFKAFSGFNAEQELLASHFFMVAPQRQQHLLQEKMNHPAMAEVKDFQAALINKASKNDLLNSLQMLVGYGGLIHNFKNYVIRGQRQDFERYNELYRQANNIIGIYRALPSISQKETAALNAIEETFMQYDKFLDLIKTLIDENRPIGEIDSLVKVNDEPALLAIQYLHKTISGQDTGLWWDMASTRIQLIKEVSDMTRGDLTIKAKNIEEATRRSLYLYITLTLSSLLVSAFLSYLLIRRLGGGIVDIASHMNNMQENRDFKSTLNVSGRDEIGEVASAFNSLISEHKKSLEDLNLAVSVFNNTHEAIIVTDADNTILMVNSAYTEITGYSRKEVVGQSPSILRSGKQDKSFYRSLWDTLLSDGHWVGEIIIQRKDGETIPTMLNISAITNMEGEITMYIGMFLDITKRKQAEEKQDILQRQLFQAQKMESLGLLSDGIAHDFNNMLAAILGYTELAENHLLSHDNDQVLQKYLGQISQAGNRAKSVVAQLLSFSQTGGHVELQEVDIGILITESIKMIRPLLPDTIAVSQRNDCDGTLIMANTVMIHQVIMNLCINARDTIGEHGNIDFIIQKTTNLAAVCSSCHKHLNGRFLEVIVSDTGKGVAPEDIEHLFDPFYTTKNMGTEKGTGLGLAIVHGIMHEHEGHIILETTVGEGSKFRLLFPL